MTIESVPMRCTCGGEIGPDITDRLMCYQCGPADMLPESKRFVRLWTGCAKAVEKSGDGRWMPGDTIAVPKGLLKWWDAPTGGGI